MVLHSALVQELIVHKEMAPIDRAAVVRKSRAGDRKKGAEFPQKSFDHRTDISARCRVEGRTIFKIELLAANGLQPVNRLRAFADGLFNRTGACLQRDDDGVDFWQQIKRFREADRLHSPEATF